MLLVLSVAEVVDDVGESAVELLAEPMLAKPETLPFNQSP